MRRQQSNKDGLPWLEEMLNEVSSRVEFGPLRLYNNVQYNGK